MVLKNEIMHGIAPVNLHQSISITWHVQMLV